MDSDGKYKVRFGDKAFTSKKTLFLTMGHEYVHVAHLSLGLDLGTKYYNKTEYGAWFWTEYVKGEYVGKKTCQAWLGKKFGRNSMNNAEYRLLRPYRNYSNWGIPLKLPKF